MPNYCFCYSDDFNEKMKMKAAAIFVWGDIKEFAISDFTLFFPESDYDWCFVESSDVVGAVSGYVRCDDIDNLSLKGKDLERANNKKLIKELIKSDGWPLAEKWTGSFTAVSFSKEKKKLVICNDLFGYLPIYSSFTSKSLMGGTSLIVLARSIECSIDAVGVLQRIHPYYPCCGCNFGKRTLIKQISRLLPGERITISTDNFSSKSDYDNTLCSEVIDGDIDDIAKLVWESYKKEVALAIGNEDNISLALSGGWDSRLILGAVDKETTTTNCLTYGNEDIYEVEIAKRCASAVSGKFKYFSLENKYFPSRSELEQLVKKTEFSYFLSYHTILNSVKNDDFNNILLIGDLSDGLTGKGMREFYTRKYRLKSFFNSFFGIADKISKSSYESLRQWKIDKTEDMIKENCRFINLLSPPLSKLCSKELINDELKSDLDLDFMRIENNMPKFTPMFDELFTWSHYTRCGMASQPILLNNLFRTLCPPMSTRFLRLISKVHPRLRINRRLIDAIINLPELSHLNSIPSAQIPYISSRAPKVIKESIWALRAFLDDAFMKRAVKKQNPGARQQFIKWHNLAKEYGRKETKSIVQEWFSGQWLKDERFINIVKNRGELSSWPHLNSDIAIPATVSIILDLCEVGRQ